MAPSLGTGGDGPTVTVANGDGKGPLVLVCDHASNHFPSPYDKTLGVSEAEKTMHVAWDPGALSLSLALGDRLDAPVVYPGVSRLIIDCNREEDREDLTPSLSEIVEVPGNRNLVQNEINRRLDMVHRPFHKAIAQTLDTRASRNLPNAVVSIHTYTPVFKGKARPWEIGLIYGEDRRLAEPVLNSLKSVDGLTVGDNQPYSPSDGVYYTVRRHGEARGLPCLMIEVRNNELQTPQDEAKWADLLAPVLSSALSALEPQARRSAGDAHA